jgi:hypothetical protein
MTNKSVCYVRTYLNICTKMSNVELRHFFKFLSFRQKKNIFVQCDHAVEKVYVYLRTGGVVLVEPKKFMSSGTKA